MIFYGVFMGFLWRLGQNNLFFTGVGAKWGMKPRKLSVFMSFFRGHHPLIK
jgi:hypothetical protein